MILLKIDPKEILRQEVEFPKNRVLCEITEIASRESAFAREERYISVRLDDTKRKYPPIYKYFSQKAFNLRSDGGFVDFVQKALALSSEGVLLLESVQSESLVGRKIFVTAASKFRGSFMAVVATSFEAYAPKVAAKKVVRKRKRK